jgi:predicted Zn finger-like uncharacterized protein
LRAAPVLPCRAEELWVSRMKFVCERCQTRYSIADDKVRQKILRIRCKTCGNVILVQESAGALEGITEGSGPHLPGKAVPSSGPKLAPVPPKVASGLKRPAADTGAPSEPKLPPAVAGKPTSEPKLPPAVPVRGASGPKAPPVSPGKSPSGPKSSPKESQRARVATPPPPPPPAPAVAHDPLGGRVEWYIAVDGVQSGPFSRTEAAKRILAMDPGKAVHVWKEGMPVWKAASEVSVIAREINLLKPAPPPPPPSAPPTTPPPVVAMPAGRVGVPAKSGAPLGVATPGPVAAMPSTPPPAPPPSGPPHLAGAAPDPEVDLFQEAETRKRQRVADVVTTPLPAPFTDATTRKGKSLHDLESKAPSARVVPDSEDQQTPPPVRPLPPVGAKLAAIPPPRLALGDQPTFPNPLPRVDFETEPSITLDADESAGNRPSAAGGFSEVVAAAAAGLPAGPSAAVDVVPLVGVDLAAAVVDSAPKKSRMAELFERQTGLKYVAAALALVVLVLLLVLVILRGDAVKVRELNKDSEKGEPAKSEEVAQPEEVAKPEEPAPPPIKPTVATVEEPRSGGGTRSGASSGARGSSARPRATGERPATPKQPSRPPGRLSPADVPRPNPFAEKGSIVSQGQISAVVRSSANQAGLRACYERALKLDNNLTSGRMDVTVSIWASGTVQRVVVNAPSSLMLIEPCIKAAVKRWRFPPSSEDYGTNFPLILQGGM